MTLRVLLVLVLWGVFEMLFTSALSSNWGETWKVTGINPVDRPFSDVVAIPEAVKLYRQGLDPYSNNVAGQGLFYPRIWVRMFDALGLSDHVVGYGLGVVTIYLLCLSHLILTTRSKWSAVLALVGGLSSASFLVVERGNNDLLTFAFAYLASLPSAAELAAVFLFIGAILKIYPAAGLLGRALVEPLASKIKIYMAAEAAVAVYLLTQWPDIVKIQESYPRIFRQSWGVSSLAAGVDEVWHLQIRTALIVVAVLLLAIAILVGHHWSSKILSEPRVLSSPADRRRFAVFSSIFLLTFLLTPNYEYRLIFLIPLLPFYVDLLADRACRKWAAVAILLALLSIDNRIIHDSTILKATAHIARVLLFGVNGIILGLTHSLWTFGPNNGGTSSSVSRILERSPSSARRADPPPAPTIPNA